MMYSITKQIRINHLDGWFYQFSDYEDGTVEVSYYELREGKETKVGQSFHIPKDCITHFINTLSQFESK